MELDQAKTNKTIKVVVDGGSLPILYHRPAVLPTSHGDNQKILLKARFERSPLEHLDVNTQILAEHKS